MKRWVIQTLTGYYVGCLQNDTKVLDKAELWGTRADAIMASFRSGEKPVAVDVTITLAPKRGKGKA